MKAKYYILNISVRVALCLGLALSTFGASATLGDGKMSKEKPKLNTLSSNKVSSRTSLLSLQSGYSFRGNSVISMRENRYFSNNTVVTYQQGHTTYTLPLQKKTPLNGRLTFNPNKATR